MNQRPANDQIFLQPPGKVWLDLGRGILLAILFSLVMILLIALLLYLTALPESMAPYLVYAVSVVAVLWGAAHSARRIGSRGWLNGGIVGVVYVLLLLGAGLIALEGISFGWTLLVKIFLGFVFGAAGGMWGVNYQ